MHFNFHYFTINAARIVYLEEHRYTMLLPKMLIFASTLFNCLQIALATLGVLAFIWSFFEVGAWRRRQGLQYVEGSVSTLFHYIS